jgi:hypothetical protein
MKSINRKVRKEKNEELTQTLSVVASAEAEWHRGDTERHRDDSVP